MQNNQSQISSTLAINVIPPEKLTIILNDFITKTVNHLNKLSINVEDKFQSFDEKLDDLEIMISLLESKLNSLPPEITSTYPVLQQCNLDDVNPVINIVPSSSVQPSSSVPQSSSSIPVAPPMGNVPVAPPMGNVPVAPPMGNVPVAPPLGKVPVPPPLGNVPVPPPLGSTNIQVPIPNMNNVKVPVPNIPGVSNVPVPNVPGVSNVPVPNVPGVQNQNNNNNEEVKEEEKELTPQQQLDKFLEEHQELMGLNKMLKLKIPAGGVLQKAQMTRMNMDNVNMLLDLYKKAHPGS